MLPNAKQVVRRKPRSNSPREDLILDLHSQLEELLNEVWRCEAEWRFDDRLDLARQQTR